MNSFTFFGQMISFEIASMISSHFEWVLRIKHYFLPVIEDINVKAGQGG